MLVGDPVDGSTVRTIDGADVGINVLGADDGVLLGLTVGVSEG